MRVIRAGEVVQEVFRRRSTESQGLDWALLDIFAPFKAEYHGEEHQFGSLWTPWLDAIMAAVKGLKDIQGSTLPGSPNVPRQQEQTSAPRLEVE